MVSDVRQRAVMQTFTAHNSRIRSIAFDKVSQCLVTGSVDGDLKVKHFLLLLYNFCSLLNIRFGMPTRTSNFILVIFSLAIDSLDQALTDFR